MAERGLKSGDVVVVKSAPEILATLDALGDLESMPFMPEMLRYCGRRFVVAQRADKVCDTSHLTGSRHVPGSVFLEDLRCDGQVHGGCQAECKIFWKEAWLRREEAGVDDQVKVEPVDERISTKLGFLASSKAEVSGNGQEVFRCQATQVHFASRHLRTYDPRPYFRELANGNVSLGRFLRVMARATVIQPLDTLGLRSAMPVRGTRSPDAPPEPALGLKPGDWVRVKPKEEIASTLSAKGKNRGLWFDREMVLHCGRVFRVRQRVSRIIDERSGNMIEMKNDCVTLEGAVCGGDLSPSRWFCPRAIYPYWRECWLERVKPEDARSPSSSAGKMARPS
jgi:hypothetical protein